MDFPDGRTHRYLLKAVKSEDATCIDKKMLHEKYEFKDQDMTADNYENK